MPAFFDEYCPRRLSLYLASFSQAENEDYRSDRSGIGRYTLTVTANGHRARATVVVRK